MIHRPSARAGLLVLAPIALASCSSAPPPPPTTTPAVTVSGAALAEPPPAPAPSFGPVREPNRLSAVIRIGAPAQDLPILGKLVPQNHPMGQVLALPVDALAKVAYGSLGAEVDTSLPLDIAMLADEGSSEQQFVWSVVLRDVAAARKAGEADFELRQAENGTVAVTPRKDATNAGAIGRNNLACRVYPGGEPVLQHLVCASSPRTLADGGAYLARTVARGSAAPGVSFDVPDQATARVIADTEKGLDDGDGADSGGEQLGKLYAQQFLGDFGGLGGSLAVNAQGVTLGIDLRFRSIRSPVSVLALTAPSQAIPATFWSIPKDADVGLALPGTSGEAIRKALGPTFWTSMAELAKQDMDADSADRMAAEAEKLFLTGGPVVFAHGPADPPAKPGKPPADPAKRYAKARAESAGWTLLAVDEPASRWTSGIHELMRLDKNVTSKPRTKPLSNLATRSEWKEAPVRASDKLPKGTLHIVDHNRPNPEYQPAEGRGSPVDGPYDTHLFIGGDAARTWFVFSENEALARAKLNEVTAAGATGIQGRSDLAPIKSLPPGGAGFATIRGLYWLAKDENTNDQLAEAAKTLASIRALPSSGAEPMFLSLLSAPQADSAGVALRLTAIVPPVAMMDLLQLFTGLASAPAAAPAPTPP